MTRPRAHRRVRPAVLVGATLARFAPDLLPRFQKTLIRRAYDMVNRRTADEVAYLNYGYAALGKAEDHQPGGAVRGAEHGAERYSRQLYLAVADAVDLAGKDVLEVGCGRGGGALFLARHRSARSVTGVDFAPRATRSWKANGNGAARFLLGDAERLPFPPASFDVVINVESSHCYPNVEAFLGEVRRVLRRGGSFLFADFRSSSDMKVLRGQMASCGFAVVEGEPITPNVVRALELDTARRLEMMRRTVPRLLHGVARDFMGVEGSEVFQKLRSGRLVYERLTMQKP